MLKVYKSTERGLAETDEVASGCWVHIESPEPAEIERLREFGIPERLVGHVLDPDERPRSLRDDGVVLIVLHFPIRQDQGARITYISGPLSIFLTDSLIVTVAPHATGLLQELARDHLRDMSPQNRARFVLHLMWAIADEYLDGLREVNAAVEQLEQRLQRSLRNAEVRGLLEYEKSLVYFTTSLTSNEIVLERLRRGSLLEWRPEDEELLDDVLTEVRQALAMVDISQRILSEMMDAFASIVSNNLNTVMKFLTSATIILAIPTVIASLYGMNVGLPGGHHPFAFAAIVALCVAISALVAYVFARRDWL
jgi:magnesium transporter